MHGWGVRGCQLVAQYSLVFRETGLEGQVNTAKADPVSGRDHKGLLNGGLIEESTVPRSEILKPPLILAECYVCMLGGDGIVGQADVIVRASAQNIAACHAEFFPGPGSFFDEQMRFRRRLSSLASAAQIAPQKDHQQGQKGIEQQRKQHPYHQQEDSRIHDSAPGLLSADAGSCAASLTW